MPPPLQADDAVGEGPRQLQRMKTDEGRDTVLAANSFENFQHRAGERRIEARNAPTTPV